MLSVTHFEEEVRPAEFVLKCIIIGECSVGKTSILRQYINREFNRNYLSTIGADFKSRAVTINGRFGTLHIWDTAGQEKFQSIATSYFRGAHIVFVVFDVCDEQSFKQVDKWITIFRNTTGEDAKSALITMALVGNKTDCVDGRKISAHVAQQKADSYNIPYYDVSATEYKSVEQLFTATSANAFDRYFKDAETRPIRSVMPNTISLESNTTATATGSTCGC